MMFKTQLYKATKMYNEIMQVKAAVKHNDIFEELEDKDRIYKSLNDLTTYLFNKIED